MKCLKPDLLGLLAVMLAASAAVAQVNSNTANWFPFTVSGYDATTNALNLSSLNPGPAGCNGFLRPQNGVIADGAGNRVRLFGVNLVAGANFPDKTLAPQIAKHLAKLGINIVRLTCLDNSDGLDGNGNSVSLLKYPNYDAIDTNQLDKLDFFISELKKQGVYVNIGLHCQRTYTNTPSGFLFSDGLDSFYPACIATLKQYSHDLLTHVNPYTGLSYVNEPAIATIEVSNEDSLMFYPLTQLAQLPEPFYTELRNQWTTWLRAKYGSTAGLQAAWGVNDGSVGPNLARLDYPLATWGWALENDDPTHAAASVSSIPGVANGVRFVVTHAGNYSYDLQLTHSGLALTNNQALQVSFRIRASSPVPANGLSGSLIDQVNYANCGWNWWSLLTTNWMAVTNSITIAGATGNPLRLSFSCNNQTGAYDIADVTLQTVSSGALLPGQTFENNNIPFTAASSSQVARRDFGRFIVETERAFATTMHSYIKQTLGARQMIYHSQAVYGGMTGALREKIASDLVDTHTYWDPPATPGGGWLDPANWAINNISQITDANGGALAFAALQRVQGMPFTVSEYNNCAPSDYTAESWPLLAAVAGFQDWDGIYLFDYVDWQGSYNENGIYFFWDVQGHPAQTAFTPLAALLFRAGLVQPANQTVVLTASETAIDNDQTDTGDMVGSFERFWMTTNLPPAIALLHKTALNPLPGSSAATSVNSVPTLTQPAVSDTSQITWNAAQTNLVLNAPAARLLLGNVTGKTVIVGDVKFQVSALGGTGFGYFGLIALDKLPIAQSRKVLLVALQRAENQMMGWNSTRTSVGNNWGYGPAVALGVTATLTLPNGGWTVDALDPTGSAKQRLGTNLQSFSIKPSYKTVWYLLSK